MQYLPWLVWLSGLGTGLQTKGCQFDSQSGHMPGRRPGSQLGARERQWINIPIAHQKKHATPDSLDRALTYFPLGCQVKKMTTANTIVVQCE